MEKSSATEQPSTISNEPTHFDALIKSAENNVISVATVQARSNFIDREMFHSNVCGGLSICGAVMGLKSLETDTEDTTARASNDAIYDIIEETPMFQFMLNPQGKWIPRIMAISAFTVPKAKAVAQELEQKAKATKPAKKGKNTAPENNNLMDGKSLAERAREQE